MDIKSIKYKEKIYYPVFIRITIILLTVLFFYFALSGVIGSIRGKFVFLFPSVYFILSIAIPALVLINTIATFKITISKGLLWIRGHGKFERYCIPLVNVVSCKPLEHHYPFVKNYFSSSQKGPEDSTVLAFPGFKGSGVLLEYKVESIFSNIPETNKLHLPSNNSEKLANLLTQQAAKS